MSISNFAVPGIFVFVLIYGLIKKIDVFAEFIEGVKDGLKTVLDIFPSLFALILAVGMFRSSGGMEFLSALLKPVADGAGFPAEVIPLVMLRPFSGSGAIALFENILNSVGADSFAGRVSSVILGSSETTFYTIAVYFAATKVKKTRHALPAALSGDLAAAVFSTLAVRWLL
ncbi:MAG: spore maturation protein [Eubacterium sp.]|nr:spore maturation protein [Eubacterium sp.]